MLYRRYPATRFHLLGRMDTDNPTGFTQDEVKSGAREHIVEYHEETRDVRPFLTAAHVFVLPSYYREGLPRTLLEALATGRPIITTDMPGCRELVREGLNGFLVPPRNAEKLAAAMERFLADPALSVEMGANARRFAEEQYHVAKVNALVIDCIRLDRSDRHAASGSAPLRQQANPSLSRYSIGVIGLLGRDVMPKKWWR